MKWKIQEIIDKERLKILRELEEGEVRWTNTKTDCRNCENKNAEEYELINLGKWEIYYLCKHCGFDPWVQSAADLNFDLMVLGEF